MVVRIMSPAHPSGASLRVAIGSDHGGFELKSALKRWLEGHGYQVVDRGTHDGSPCDYPVIAAAVAREVSSGSCGKGVIVDGAGIGSSMVANKLPGVRAALCYDLSSARNSREHNDANVLTLGARLIGPGLAEQILEAFLDTECTEERHLKRVAMIAEVTGQGAGCGCSATADPSSSSEGAGASRWSEGTNFTLAGSAHPAHNAASPAGGTRGGPPDPRSVAFQARAARWLTMDGVDNLSAEDLDRVAARIAQLIASGSEQGGRWCFGDVCIDSHAAAPWITAGVARLSNGLGNGAPVREIASYIDHTLLKPDATRGQVLELCDEARQYRFASVCVNPGWVRLCADQLRGSQVLVCTVVGFPLGANVADIKAMEARRAIRDGAGEIDMVINIGALKGGDDKLVFDDIRAVVDACEDGRAICKVIIETALLTDEEKVRACIAARRARADFVKTSTGFASGGATAADVALMARVVADARMGVKASGGVRNLDDFDAMVRAGATRIGASAGVKIIKEANA